MRLFAFLSALILSCGSFGQSEGRITCVAQLAEAILAESPTARPFGFDAQITALVPHGERYIYLTVADATGHAFVVGEIRADAAPFTRGDIVRLGGTIIGDTARFSDIARLATAAPPEPREVTARDVAEGRVDWQYVRLQGMIRDIRASETDRRWTFLVLVSGEETIYVALPANDCSSFLGATVKIDGFANPRDRSQRVYLGRTFHCRGPADIHILSTPAVDAFAVPGIRALRHSDPQRISRLGRHHLHGRILTRFKKNQALARTSDGDVVRLIFDTPPPPVGTFLIASGFPETDFFHLTLTHVVWEPMSPPHDTRPDPPTRDIADIYRRRDTEQPLNAELHGRSIRVTGVIRSRPTPDDPAPKMLIESSGHLATVNVECLPSAEDLPPVGSEITLTGTCVLETEDYRTGNPFPQINGFTIVLNGSDLTVLRRPSWWTPKRLLTIIVILVMTLTFFVAWNRILNRLVERRGRQLLREHLGHTAADLRTRERTRLAIELHDSLAQNLTGVSMEIEAAGRCGRTNLAGLLQHLSVADKALKSCRNALRNTLWDLRNQSLEEKDLAEAIRRTILPHTKRTRLEINVSIPRKGLSDNTTHDILCMVRELALNGLLHGHATALRIMGTSDHGMITLQVVDNGSGFDPGRAPGVTEGHFGIEGIRERLRALEGSLSYEHHPGGMTATIAFPYPREGRRNTDR